MKEFQRKRANSQSKRLVTCLPFGAHDYHMLSQVQDCCVGPVTMVHCHVTITWHYLFLCSSPLACLTCCQKLSTHFHVHSTCRLPRSSKVTSSCTVCVSSTDFTIHLYKFLCHDIYKMPCEPIIIIHCYVIVSHNLWFYRLICSNKDTVIKFSHDIINVVQFSLSIASQLPIFLYIRSIPCWIVQYLLSIASCDQKWLHVRFATPLCIIKW